MEELIHSLVRGADWHAAVRAGRYDGSADDRRDGFLHFSTAAQVRGSAEKHRSGEPDLWLVTVEAVQLGAALRWEPGMGRAGLFPHLHGPLPVAAVRSAVPLVVDANGRHVFPAGIP